MLAMSSDIRSLAVCDDFSTIVFPSWCSASACTSLKRLSNGLPEMRWFLHHKEFSFGGVLLFFRSTGLHLLVGLQSFCSKFSVLCLTSQKVLQTFLRLWICGKLLKAIYLSVQHSCGSTVQTVSCMSACGGVNTFRH